jgi:geranylgeranyl diphosphate synthase type I
MPAAAAIALARAFALIHLEVSDGRPGGGASGSRERSPVWWVWGHSQGINAGDAMYALARLAVMDLGSRGIPPETVVRATAALDHACLELCERRYAADEDEASDGRTPDGYLRTVDGTTGALGACAAAMGALAAGARGPVVAALGQFGRAAGGAWHLRQEIDGIWAEGGAGAGLVDALDRRRTLPLVFALSAATGERRARLEAAARRETMLTDEELGRLAGLVEELGARRFTEAAIAQRLGLAMDALELARVPDEAAAPLRGLARYLAGAAEGRRPS